MKLIFFDESKNDAQYEHYHLGAVCIDEEQLAGVEAAVNALALETFGSAELSHASEFHAAEIFHRKSNFKGWLDFDKRVALLSRLADVLTLEGVQRIDIQVNCAYLHPSQDAAEIAFMFLCERANDLVKAQGKLGMLIGDRENDRLSARFSTTLSAYRASGTEFAYGRDIHNLVDSVHFTHSYLSRFLQLADVYCWFLQFRNRNLLSENFRHRTMLESLRRDGTSVFFANKYKEWPKG